MGFLNAFSTVRMLDKRTFAHLMTANDEPRFLGTDCRICANPRVHDKVATLEISASALFYFNQVSFEKERQRPERPRRTLASIFPNLDYFIVVDDSDLKDRATMSRYIWADLHMAGGIFSPWVEKKVEHRRRGDGIPSFVIRDGLSGFDLSIPLDGYWDGRGIGCS